jgi:transcriptional regulator with XRE-family HTH domain
MGTKKTFGAWLRGRRAELRQTIAESAEVLGISENTMSRWERELLQPVKVVDIHRLADWAGESATDVFELLEPSGEPAKTAATG